MHHKKRNLAATHDYQLLFLDVFFSFSFQKKKNSKGFHDGFHDLMLYNIVDWVLILIHPSRKSAPPPTFFCVLFSECQAFGFALVVQGSKSCSVGDLDTS